MRCSALNINGRFGGIQPSIEKSTKHGDILAGFLVVLLFDPEDGGGIVFQNVS
jgi:hypothetical protein